MAPFFGELFAAVPDWSFEVGAILADGDRAAARWNATGTFAGDAAFQGIEPTGGRFELGGFDLLTTRDGLIVANDAFSDGMGFARQIGLLPPAGSGAEAKLQRAFNAIAERGPSAAWPGHAEPLTGDVAAQLERAAAATG